MKWKILSVSSMVLLQSCTALTALDFIKGLAGDKPAINAEAHVGDNNATVGNSSAVGDIEVEKGTVSVDSSTKESKFSGQAEQVTINESSWWQQGFLILLAFLLGLFLPQARWRKEKGA
jgi:hypothetical protein